MASAQQMTKSGSTIEDVQSNAEGAFFLFSERTRMGRSVADHSPPPMICCQFHRANCLRPSWTCRSGCQHASRHARERHRLQPDFHRTGHRGNEQAFATEECVFDSTDELNVISDGWLQCDEAASIELKCFALVQSATHECSSGMNHNHAVTLQRCITKPSPRIGQRRFFAETRWPSVCRVAAQIKGPFLTDQFAAELSQI